MTLAVMMRIHTHVTQMTGSIGNLAICYKSVSDIDTKQNPFEREKLLD